MNKPEAPETIDFGFEKVDVEEKTSRVAEVFDSVAGNYDIMNDIMSGGMHRIWKDQFVAEIPRDSKAHLDVAGGTGDISFRIATRLPETAITISDINPHMLEEGQKRAEKNGFSEHFTWKEANAEQLPFDDNSFDSYTIAFGIRNVTHRDKALAEAHRVLKPGGCFLCLEFTPVEHPLFKKFYDFYSFGLIPLVGQLVAGDKESYQYLVESIRMFPNVLKFRTMIQDAGFKEVSYRTLTMDSVAIHKGWKV